MFLSLNYAAPEVIATYHRGDRTSVPALTTVSLWLSCQVCYVLSLDWGNIAGSVYSTVQCLVLLRYVCTGGVWLAYEPVVFVVGVKELHTVTHPNFLSFQLVCN